MTDRYEKAARIYCEEMGLDADANVSSNEHRWMTNLVFYAQRLREHDAMNRALKAVETNDE